MRKRPLFCILCLVLCAALCLPALADVTITFLDEVGDASVNQNQTDLPETEEVPVSGGAREDFINDIIALGKKEYEHTNGRAQEAQYSSSIFICKNFTVYLFRQNAEKYRMAEFPDVELKIPDNLPKDQCTDFSYGIVWKDIPASEGNPFEVAAQFIYDPNLSKEENWENARAFLKNVKKGDYFQMSAKYYYGTGAHSMIFIADYDPETDTVRWMDSNMKGEKRNGIRYAYVQFDAVKEIDWFVEAFCRKNRGATLYRLRDDIVYAD